MYSVMDQLERLDPFQSYFRAIPCWQHRPDTKPMWIVYSVGHGEGRPRSAQYHSAHNTRKEAAFWRDSQNADHRKRHLGRKWRWADESYHIAPILSSEPLQVVMWHLSGKWAES
jgi:hypothetical protein